GADAQFDDATIAGPTVTFDKAGSYTFSVTVTDDDAAEATDTVVVTVSQTGTTITVSPSTQDLFPETSKQFTAAQFDQFGDAHAGQSFVWSVDEEAEGEIDESGLYTAPSETG